MLSLSNKLVLDIPIRIIANTQVKLLLNFNGLTSFDSNYSVLSRVTGCHVSRFLKCLVSEITAPLPDRCLQL